MGKYFFPDPRHFLHLMFKDFLHLMFNAALMVGKSFGRRIVPVALILAANSAAVAAAFSAATFSA